MPIDPNGRREASFCGKALLVRLVDLADDGHILEGDVDVLPPVRMGGRAPPLDVLAGDRLGERGIRLDLDRSRVVHCRFPFLSFGRFT